jgi:hypothetical protein
MSGRTKTTRSFTRFPPSREFIDAFWKVLMADDSGKASYEAIIDSSVTGSFRLKKKKKYYQFDELWDLVSEAIGKARHGASSTTEAPAQITE